MKKTKFNDNLQIDLDEMNEFKEELKNHKK
jgi:hypothetical protein